MFKWYQPPFLSSGLDTCTGMCSWKICIRTLFDSRNGSPCHCNIYCNSIFPLFIPIRGFFPDYAPGIFRHKKRRSKRVIIGYSGKIFHERPGKTWKKQVYDGLTYLFSREKPHSPGDNHKSTECSALADRIRYPWPGKHSRKNSLPVRRWPAVTEHAQSPEKTVRIVFTLKSCHNNLKQPKKTNAKKMTIYDA